MQNSNEIMNLFIEYNQSYYNGSPLISDEEYDKFVAANGLGEYPSSYGVKVQNKVSLPTPIHGMDKIQKINEYKSFMKNFNEERGIVFSEKLDGMALLFDLRGKLIHVYTRGDVKESTGQIVDWILDGKLAEPIKELHKNQETNFFIRGELIISKKNFETVSSETGMENPLSFIAGYVNGKDRTANYLDLLDFRAFEIFRPDILEQDTPLNQFKDLQKFGLSLPNHEFLEENVDFSVLPEILNSFRNTSEYVIDGIIIAKNAKYVRETKRNPQHAKAFKRIDTQIAKVNDVKWKVSADLKLTPIIYIEPVKIDGKVFTSVTGKNAKYVVENMIGPGAEVIMGANVVPVIYGVHKKAEELSLPENYEERGPFFYMKEENNEVRVKKLEKFFTAIGTEGLKEGSSTKFVINGIKDPSEVVLTNSRTFVEIFGKVQGLKLYNEFFDKLLKASEAQYMNSSCIFPGIGEKTFNEILKKTTMKELRTFEASSKGISKPETVGDVKWEDFLAGLGRYFEWKDKMGLEDKDLEISEEDLEDSDLPTEDKVYFILSGKPPRDTKIEFVKKLPKNYIEVSTVSKADVLIQSRDSMTKKTEDAKRKGVLIKNYEDFM